LIIAKDSRVKLALQGLIVALRSEAAVLPSPVACANWFQETSWSKEREIDEPLIAALETSVKSVMM